MINFKNIFFGLLFAVFCTPSAYAQSSAQPIDVLPASELSSVESTIDTETHPPITITPDKSEIIDLDSNISTIIIGNPAHANIFADTSRRLVIVPRQAGATHFTALNDQGEVIMQRHVIIAPPKKKYLRVRQSCQGQNEDCTETRFYYCPDICHEIVADDGETAASSAGDMNAATAANLDELTGDLANPEAENE